MLKGQSKKMFDPWFFINPDGPLIKGLKYFWFWLIFRELLEFCLIVPGGYVTRGVKPW